MIAANAGLAQLVEHLIRKMTVQTLNLLLLGCLFFLIFVFGRSRDIFYNPLQQTTISTFIC